MQIDILVLKYSQEYYFYENETNFSLNDYENELKFKNSLKVM